VQDKGEVQIETIVQKYYLECDLVFPIRKKKILKDMTKAIDNRLRCCLDVGYL
jgi:hypothetical protein